MGELIPFRRRHKQNDSVIAEKHPPMWELVPFVALFIFAQVGIVYMLMTGPVLVTWQEKAIAYTLTPFVGAGCAIMDVVLGMLVWDWLRSKW